MEEYINAAEIRRSKKKPALVLNHGGQFRQNEVALGAFKSTTIGDKENWVGYKDLSPTEIRLDRVAEGTPGAVKFRPAGNDQSALHSAGPILADTPALKVDKGYLRLLSFRIETSAEGKDQFIIILEPNKVIPAPKRTTTKKAAKAKGTHPVTVQA